jgi:glucokinase
MTEQESAARTRGTVAAIDVGGTAIKGALVTDDLRIVAEARRPTPRAQGPDAVVEAIAAVAAELLAQAHPRPVAIGVVVPGIVEESTGIARYSANLGWRDLPLAAHLHDRTGLPVALGHDVRAGALAEWRLGAGRGATGLLFLPLGFGIAGAIVADGRMITGNGYAGEVGHLQVEPAGDRCGCGQLGCLETIASAASVGRRYAVRAGLPAPVGAREVAALVQAGTDPDAQAVWAEAVDALAGAITTVNAITAPDVVVIGGGLSLAGDLLLAPLRTAVQARATFLPLPRIVSAELGDRAGSLGAAMLALDLVGRPTPTVDRTTTAIAQGAA